jgi:Phosphate uptake regulator
MPGIENGPHTVSAFDEELMGVRARIAEMGGLAEEMLSQALEGLEKRDGPALEGVILRDKRLDALEALVEEQIIRLIALRAPWRRIFGFWWRG